MVVHRLRRVYGKVHPAEYRGRPLDELVLTILSQNTTDANAQRAYHSLKRRFSSWHAVAESRLKAIEAAIHCGGLARKKAAAIRNVLRTIRAREGRLSLARLSRVSTQEAYAYLVSLRGVGPKTASCVLLFGFGKPAFPVDTHIFRVAKRLGWIRKGIIREKAAEILGKLIPDDIVMQLHLYLVWHGREVCHSALPACQRCVISSICRTANS